MKRLAQLAVLLGTSAVCLLAQGEVIDRIVASVNHQVILLSDWDEGVAYEALANARPLAEVTAEERQKTLQRMIDHLLVREHMNGDEPQVSAEEIERRLSELRATSAGDDGWTRALHDYGLTEEAVRERLSDHLTLLLFVEQRLRPSVRVDADAIERYYRETFLPQLKRTGAREVELREVNARIEELLVQQRMNELLDAWLHNLREQSTIRVR